VRLGDSARQRLVRVETLAAKTPGDIEGALAISRAAIDATEFAKARAALSPFIANPTQRVAMLMAEIERTEHGDSGKARMWTLRAVRARHDPAWTADGYVSERWRPVSPVTGRLDAFQWQTPVASLPSSDKTATIESSPFEEAMLAAPAPRRVTVATTGLAEPPREDVAEMTVTPATQDNLPPQSSSRESSQPSSSQDPIQESHAEKAAESAVAPPPAAATTPEIPASAAPAESASPAAPAPMFRTRADLSRPAAPIPAVIPIVRPPDDPGIDDDSGNDEFVERIGTPKAQAGGWRGFLARWGG
jgi:HemY protein